MVDVYNDIDFNMIIPVEIDNTVNIKFVSFCSDLRDLGFLGRPVGYLLTSVNCKDILYYPVFIDKYTVLYIELVNFNGYVECSTLEFLDAINRCDFLSVETKNTLELGLKKYFFNYDDLNISNNCNITNEQLFRFSVDDEVFWRPCFQAINEVDKKLTVMSVKAKLSKCLVLDESCNMHLPCIVSRGIEKYLCDFWVNCFYYNIPVLTLTCKCIAELNSVLKICGDDDAKLHTYAVSQPSEETFYYKDFKFGRDDIYYLNAIIWKKDLFKFIYESDNYKIERFLNYKIERFYR